MSTTDQPSSLASLLTQFQETHNDVLSSITQRNKAWVWRESERKTMQHDALFHWVPTIEEFMGNFIGEPAPGDQLESIRDVLGPGMVVTGEITAVTQSGVVVALQDIVFTSTITNYLSILAESQKQPSVNRKPLRYNSKESPIERRASFCGNAHLPRSNTLQKLKELFLKQNTNTTDVLQGFCAQREFGDFTFTDFSVGQKVVALVLVVPRSDRVSLSFRNSYISTRFYIGLGPRETEEPIIAPRSRSFNEIVLATNDFSNPYSLEKLANYYNLDTKKSMLTRSALCPPFSQLRNEQSKSYINEAVRRGVEYSSQERYADAIKCYDEALSMDNKNVNAMVARGAALANLREFARAIRQLEAALNLDSRHVNAKKYLKAIEDKLEAERLALNPPRKSIVKRNTTTTTDDVIALLEKTTKHKHKHKRKERDRETNDHRKSHKKEKSKRKSYHRDNSDRGRSNSRGHSKERRNDKTLSPPPTQRQNARPSPILEPPKKRNKL